MKVIFNGFHSSCPNYMEKRLLPKAPLPGPWHPGPATGSTLRPSRFRQMFSRRVETVREGLF